MRLGSVVVLLWLLIGVGACVQRGYFKSNDTSCAKTGTVVVTVLAGPLNYLGVNPKVHDCNVPHPTKWPEGSTDIGRSTVSGRGGTTYVAASGTIRPVTRRAE